MLPLEDVWFPKVLAGFLKPPTTENIDVHISIQALGVGAARRGGEKSVRTKDVLEAGTVEGVTMA